MTPEHILDSLCAYDERSPYYYCEEGEEPTKPRNDCYCDNCFYGRDELAVHILNLTMPEED